MTTHEEARAELKKQYLSVFSKDRYCSYCSDYYCINKSIGLFQCSYHPGHIVFNETLHKQVYDCCPLLPIELSRRKGCTSCDHHDTSIEREIKVPLFLFTEGHIRQGQVDRKYTREGENIFKKAVQVVEEEEEVVAPAEGGALLTTTATIQTPWSREVLSLPSTKQKTASRKKTQKKEIDEVLSYVYVRRTKPKTRDELRRQQQPIN